MQKKMGKIMMPMTRHGRTIFGHSFSSEAEMKKQQPIRGSGSADLEAIAYYVSAGHAQDYGSRIVPLEMISDQILSSSCEKRGEEEGGGIEGKEAARSHGMEGVPRQKVSFCVSEELPEELKEVVLIPSSTLPFPEAESKDDDGSRIKGARRSSTRKGGDSMMQDLQLGIRYSVGRISMMNISSSADPSSSRALFHSKSAAISVSFPSHGSQTTPPHPYSADFKWKDYCPLAFRLLRHMFHIDAAEYMLSICGSNGLRKLSSPGKSGSTFYYSHDDRFVIKTLRKSELKVLLRMLPRYFAHVQKHQNTLLTRFLGLHMIKTLGGQKVRFVVMENAISTASPIHRKFDLKGSSHGRSAALNVSDMRRESTVLKDLDLDYVFRLDGPSKDSLLRQIAEDCKFLESENIMDYSLLLGLHFNEQSTTKSGVNKDLWVPCPPQEEVCRWSKRTAGGAIGSSNISAKACSVKCPNDARDVTLYLGIIDILQEYDMGKKLEHAYKSLHHDALSISAVDPALYSKRFQRFMRNIFVR